MSGEYPRKYWWLILIVIPVAVAVIQIYPDLADRDNSSSGPQTPAPVPKPSPLTGPSLKEIVTAPGRLSILVGDTGAVRVELRDVQGATLKGQRIDWTSSNVAVATVSSSGRVTGVGEGVTLISAAAGGLLATTEVTVKRVPLAQIVVQPDKYSISAGATFPLKAELRDQRGKLVDRPVEWRSEHTDVAYVTSTGVVKGLKFGIAEIVAAQDGIEGRAKMFICDPHPPGMCPVEARIIRNR